MYVCINYKDKYSMVFPKNSQDTIVLVQNQASIDLEETLSNLSRDTL